MALRCPFSAILLGMLERTSLLDLKFYGRRKNEFSQALTNFLLCIFVSFIYMMSMFLLIKLNVFFQITVNINHLDIMSDICRQ